MELVNKIVVAACAGCCNRRALGAIAVCTLYAAPFAKQHILGGCTSQTNRVQEVKGVRATNPLKASKRAAAAK